VTRNHWTWRRESTDAAETEKPKESEDSEDSYETDETEDQAEDQAERVLFPPGEIPSLFSGVWLTFGNN
jgi:hypothetical protein